MLPDGQSVDAPRGFVEMCLTHAELCRAETKPATSTMESQTLDKLLVRINRLVNGRVRQRDDTSIFGVKELWRRSGIGRSAQGDCEDFAIEKREQLIAAGVPASMLFFATVWRADLGLHTLLIARTTEGDMVLDSRSPYVESWRRAPYVWISRQHPERPDRWTAISNVSAMRLAGREAEPVEGMASGALGGPSVPLLHVGSDAPVAPVG
jgi:predicted transglutaminase-like cysteine proteinase